MIYHGICISIVPSVCVGLNFFHQRAPTVHVKTLSAFSLLCESVMHTALQVWWSGGPSLIFSAARHCTCRRVFLSSSAGNFGVLAALLLLVGVEQGGVEEGKV